MRRLTSIILLLFFFLNLEGFAAVSDSNLFEGEVETSKVLEKVPELEPLMAAFVLLSFEFNSEPREISFFRSSIHNEDLPILKLIQSSSNRSQAPPLLS